MNKFRAARLLALCSVLHPEWDEEYELRRLYRDYSKRFRTPLHLVSELPLDDILQAVYEAEYEDLQDAEVDEKDPDQRPYIVRHRDRLIETDEERKQREIEEEEDAALGDKFLRQVEEEEAAKAKKWAEDARKGKAAPAFSVREDASDSIMRAAREEMRAISASARKAAQDLRGMPLPRERPAPRGAPDRIDMSKFPKGPPRLPPEVEVKFDIQDDED